MHADRYQRQLTEVTPSLRLWRAEVPPQLFLGRSLPESVAWIPLRVAVHEDAVRTPGVATADIRVRGWAIGFVLGVDVELRSQLLLVGQDRTPDVLPAGVQVV